jgi:hypothetical protein
VFPRKEKLAEKRSLRSAINEFGRLIIQLQLHFRADWVLQLKLQPLLILPELSQAIRAAIASGIYL